MNRKQALKTIAVGVGTATLPSLVHAGEKSENLVLKGNIHHSVCKWCYSKIPLEEMARACKAMGMESIELLGPDDWKVVIKMGLTCAMGYATSIGLNKGFNDPSLHEKLLKDYEEVIPKAADLNIRNLICFSGNRNGLDDQKGLENCAKGLEKVVKIAEKYKVTISMELLNSKVNHPDYQCDHTEWGVALCKMVGSENFKLLYDIYHMQIMEGDVIATITQYKDYISHFHTGGVPGRHELDETQELYYPAIMNAIVKNGFKGYVGQEFIPSKGDPLDSLKKAVMHCDV